MKISLNKSLKQFKILLFGSSFSFLINVVALYTYSRLYSKEEFGIYALFVSFVVLLSMMTTLGLEYVIVLQRTKKEAVFIVHVCLNIIKYFSIIIATISLVLIFMDVSFFRCGVLIWAFIPVSFFSMAGINVSLNWNNKIKNYKAISAFRFIQAIVAAFIGIVLGYLNIEIGLVISYSMGVVISYGYLYFKFKGDCGIYKYKKVISLNEIRKVVFDNKDIVYYSYGLGLIFTVVKTVPNFVLNSFFGVGVVGAYDMAIKILNIPKNILSTNIGELYYQKGSLLYNHNNKNWLSSKINMFYISKNIIL